MTYTVTLPSDPQTSPTASGDGATWNFELRPTFWFGLTLCDTASAPEFTKTCTPDSNANDLVGSDPAAPNYIGKHPGSGTTNHFGVGTDTLGVVASEASGEERDRLFRRQVQRAPQFADHEKQTERVIPVIVLTPTGTG
jgi:hypothetical protein